MENIIEQLIQQSPSLGVVSLLLIAFIVLAWNEIKKMALVAMDFIEKRDKQWQEFLDQGKLDTREWLMTVFKQLSEGQEKLVTSHDRLADAQDRMAEKMCAQGDDISSLRSSVETMLRVAFNGGDERKSKPDSKKS